MIRTESTAIFAVLRRIQRVVISPEASLVARAFSRFRGANRLRSKKGHVVEHKTGAAISQNRLVEPRLEGGEVAAGRALKVGPLVDGHRCTGGTERIVACGVRRDRSSTGCGTADQHQGRGSRQRQDYSTHRSTVQPAPPNASSMPC